MKAKIIALCLLAIFSTTSCIGKNKGVKGDKHLVTRTFEVENFDEISIGSRIECQTGINPFSKNNQPTFNYTQEQGTPSLEITMDENLFELLDVKNKNNKLTIKTKHGETIRPSSMTINGSSADLKKVHVSGSIKFMAEGPLQLTNATFDISGVADVRLNDLSCEAFDVNLSGVGNIYLTGKIKEGKYDVSGVGHVYAFDCPTEILKCDVSGVGGMEVNATKSLNASTSGIGSIKYKGNPEDLSKSTSGIGKVKPVD